jgi:23S rRNA (guanosine2251-2'-O)-methyltransferase
MKTNDYIFGLRAVIEAIKAGKDIDKVLIKKDISGDLVAELFQVIKEYGVVSQRVPVERINRITQKNHQGIVAFLSPVAYHNLDDLIPSLFEAGKLPFVVALDGITDVRNFGAIARTCECSGVDAIIIPEKNSVSVNADAVKTSAGALLHIPVVRVKNLNKAIKQLKESGLMIVGATEKGSKNYTTFDYTVPTAIVMGAEDTGISNENLRECDYLAAIPMFGQINSLNVSVAAGILIYEVVRQRADI